MRNHPRLMRPLPERAREFWSRFALAQNRIPPLPPLPTAAKPGSQEKLEVMRDRVAAGFQVFHPDDVTCFPDYKST